MTDYQKELDAVRIEYFDTLGFQEWLAGREQTTELEVEFSTAYFLWKGGKTETLAEALALKAESLADYMYYEGLYLDKLGRDEFLEALHGVVGENRISLMARLHCWAYGYFCWQLKKYKYNTTVNNGAFRRFIEMLLDARN